MSGFAGIIHLDGAPVDRELVERMARLTERHGGDAWGIHCEASFGFGHSLLASMPESSREMQPFSFDQDTWIVGDVRVDAREELVAELMACGCDAELSQPDIELVLHAFHAWGERCVDHLLGDYAFVTWCKTKRHTFCARDIFGIKPFYYQHRGDLFLFANDIDAMRAHPVVSNELNEAAICDYLAVGYNLDESGTYFAGIDRIAPGHLLKVEPESAARQEPYSRLAVDQYIRYPNTTQYGEHFLELFSKAVRDRLRTDRVGFELSGGLDSSSVAAIALWLNRSNAHFEAKGITTDNSSRDPTDEEAHYARILANHIGIEHATLPAAPVNDLYAFCATSQPYAWPFAATLKRYGAALRDYSKVALSGQGGDPGLHASGYSLLDEFRDKSLIAFAARVARLAIGKKSFRGLGLRSLWTKNAPRVRMSRIPTWIRRDFISRSGTEDRWASLFYRPGRFPEGCKSELAWDELHMPMWSHLFETYYHDLFNGIDCRHPLFDIRLIRYFFSIPASEKEDKRLLRHAMSAFLPPVLLTRNKSIARVDLVQAALSDPQRFSELDLALTGQASWIDLNQYAQALERYAEGKGGDFFTIACPLSLGMWMGAKL